MLWKPRLHSLQRLLPVSGILLGGGGRLSKTGKEILVLCLGNDPGRLVEVLSSACMVHGFPASGC